MSATPVQAVPIQEVGIVLLLDSAISTAGFWQNIFKDCIAVMLQSLPKIHGTQPQTKMRIGAVVYSRSTLNSPIITNHYFMDPQTGFREWQQNPVTFGLGGITAPGEAGMAVLEGLVAALEMCDQLISETQKPKRAAHPRIPQQPPRKTPVCHVLCIGSYPPGGSQTPMHNRNQAFDDLTLDTIPAEFSKRNIRLSCLMPHAIPAFSQLFEKIGEPAEVPWFKVPPGSVFLLSGFQQGIDAGGGKRPHASPANSSNDATAKRTKVAISPRVSAKLPGPLGSVAPTSSGIKTAPQNVPATDTQAAEVALSQPASAPPPPPAASNTPAQQEYQRLHRERLSAQINAMKPPSVPPPNLATSNSTAAANSETAAPPQPVETPAPAIGGASVGSMAAQGVGVSPAASHAMNKTASNSSQATADLPMTRPQSQPANMTAQTHQALNMARGGHNRSQSSAAGTSSGTPSVGGGIQSSPNIHASPYVQQRIASQTGASSTGGPSPSPSTMNASPKRAPSVPGGAAGLPGQNPNSLALARIQAMRGALAGPGAEAARNQEALVQQQKAMLQAQMAAGGYMNPPNPGNAGPSSSLPVNEYADVWQGTLTLNLPPVEGKPKELQCLLTAKPAGNKQSRQFVLWPQNLSFNLSSFRQYQLQEFSHIIKANNIPLCLFEPNQALAANNNGDLMRRNDMAFQLLLSSLTTRQAGAAIYFSTPAQIPGTGIFIFGPQQRQGAPATLVGAAFLVQPIPTLPPMPPLNVPQTAGPSNPNTGVNPSNMLGNMNPVMNTMGVQPTIGANPNMNAAAFDANAQAMRNNLFLQQRMAMAAQQQRQQQQQQQQMPWLQQQAGQLNRTAGGMGGPGGTLGMPPQQINPQAQAQSRLLAAGLGGGLGPGGMPGGAQGGFDGAGGMGLGLGGGGFPNPQMAGMGMNFGGGGGGPMGPGMPGMGVGMNMGMGGMGGAPGPGLNMSSFTPEMIRMLQGMGGAGGMGGQGNNS